MKKIIIYTIHLIAYIISFIYNTKTAHKIKMLNRYFYTFWVSRDFKKVGKNAAIGSFQYLKGPHNIILGDNVTIGQYCVFELYSRYGNQIFCPLLTFGNNSSIGEHSHITCINRVNIGNNVRMGRKVFITDNAHGASEIELLNIPPNYRPLYSKGPVIIEDNVWIGEMVCIMPGVKIGKGSIIGANAVVTKDVPPYSVVVGPAARIIKNMSTQEQIN